MKKMNKAPQLKTEAEAFRFWSKHDSTQYVDWSQAKKAVFPELKPTSRLISIRFPVATLDRLKAIANRQEIPYQSLIKIFVNHEIELTMRSGR